MSPNPMNLWGLGSWMSEKPYEFIWFGVIFGMTLLDQEPSSEILLGNKVGEGWHSSRHWTTDTLPACCLQSTFYLLLKSPQSSNMHVYAHVHQS